MSKVSVLIPCYKRHILSVRHIEECLKSSRVPDEIIAVNDGGDKGLDTMLVKLEWDRTKTKIIYAEVEEDILWGYNGACNLAFWLSTGDIIALEDTDHIPDRDLYKDAVEYFENNPDISRLGVRRKVINIKELEKPMEEWEIVSSWGSNQMTTLFRRDVYLALKGQDERFGGNYGYMPYCWKSRYTKAGIKTATINHYWAVIGDGGEPGIKRGMSPINRQFYKENARSGKLHSKHGILNYQFNYKTL